MVTLKNDRITLEIAERGAEMRRLILDGTDMLWSGNPAVWDGVAPMLFPICGGLRDDYYTVGGAKYTLPKHGFAKFSTFAVEERGYDFVTFLLTDTSETLKQYPWRFELRVTYRLRGVAVDVKYQVKNCSESRMYFSLGSHEAYACPEGIEDYDVIFPQKETLNACAVDGNLLAHRTKPVLRESNMLPLYDKYFATDALVFKDMKSRSATLRNRKTGRSVTVEFPGCDYFLLWTKPNSGYLCMEPWAGIPGMVDCSHTIEEKEGILSILPNEIYKQAHTIWFE